MSKNSLYFFHFFPVIVTIPIVFEGYRLSLFFNVIERYSTFLKVALTWSIKLIFKIIFVANSGSRWVYVSKWSITVRNDDERWPQNDNGNRTKMKEKLWKSRIFAFFSNIWKTLSAVHKYFAFRIYWYSRHIHLKFPKSASAKVQTLPRRFSYINKISLLLCLIVFKFFFIFFQNKH